MKYLIYLLGVISLMLFGCKSPEGEGGNSSISGVLKTSYYNDDFSELLYSDVEAGEDVYIIYGDEEFFGDNVETMHDGSFKFDYLRPGNYKLYYYSDDITDANNDNEVAIIKEVTINGKKEDVNAGDLYRQEKLDWDDGIATIKGRVLLINYHNQSIWPSFMVVKDTSLAQEQEVYLTYGNHAVYDQRIRTHHDGTFEFKSLIPGTYDVYVYSEDLSGATEDIVIHREVPINKDDDEVNIGDIYIEQL